MSKTDQLSPVTTLDEETALTRNLEIAQRELLAQLEHPELLAQIPDGATVVVIPDDDPDLAAYNLALVPALVAQGRNVYIQHVRAPDPAVR